jgi:hypothetical protein
MRDSSWKEVVLSQFLAAVQMLENAMIAAPPDVWAQPGRPIEWQETEPVGFWYLAFHALFFLDYNLSGSHDAFQPPLPFDLGELDPSGVLPGRIYSKDELLTYSAQCRSKLISFVGQLSDLQANEPCDFPGREMTVGELLLYNMRHVQHHAAQLNLLLRRYSQKAPGWVSSVQPKNLS